MQQIIQTKTRSSKFIEQDYFDRQYPDVDSESDLKHMNGFDLTDSEIEFLSMKRMKAKRNGYSSYTPDPRLGDYEA